MQDSLELHRLVRGCTARDGFAVPQARFLYRLKFKDFTNFFDDCGNNHVFQRPTEAVNNTLGMEEKHSFELYPNPNDGNMTLVYSLNKEEKGVAVINDITGKQVAVYKLNAEQNSLSIKEYVLANGVYFFSVLVDGQLVGTKKMVIIK